MTSTTIIDGNKSSRVLTINFGITVSISGVTIRNGQTVDGAAGIANSGILSLTNSTVSGNNSGGHNGAFGGGIINSGTLTLTNSTVSGNSTIGGGGIINSPVQSLDFRVPANEDISLLLCNRRLVFRGTNLHRKVGAPSSI